MHYAMGQFNSAVLLHMHGNFRAALGVYQNVPESVPDQYARAQLNLGVLYQQMGLDDKARESWNRVPADYPDLYEVAQSYLNDEDEDS